jgi:hypothetical protein
MQYKFGFGYISDSRHSKPHTHVATHIMPEFKERTLVTDPQKAFHFTDLQRLKPTRANDPYEYQAGWGNRHMSEVIPGTLPVAQNNPQEACTRRALHTLHLPHHDTPTLAHTCIDAGQQQLTV